MDNAATIPGYKYYEAPDGTRPDVAVAFLDIEEDPLGWVNGLCVPVDGLTLAALDRRERNYVRVEVTAGIEPAIGPTWAYIGREESRERYRAATRAGACVVASEYAALVQDGFRALGEREWEAFTETTSNHGPPVRELARVDI
jgi:hypothetical protein